MINTEIEGYTMQSGIRDSSAYIATANRIINIALICSCVSICAIVKECEVSQKC